MTTDEQLTSLRNNPNAKDIAEADTKDRGERMHRAETSKEYAATVVNALTVTKSHNLLDAMRDCGEWSQGNRTDCCSPYCAKDGRHNAYKDKPSEPKSCYKKITESQDALMKTVLTRYPSDTELRDNLYSVTILFAAFGYNLDGNGNPVFPMQLLKDSDHSRGALVGAVVNAKRKADAQFKALKDAFPDVAWLGGYSWEAQHGERLGLKKQASLKALKKLALTDGLASDCQTIFTSKATEPWRNHYILFHAHLVVDLRGTDHQAFRDYCHKIWGTEDNKKRPVPDGVLIKKLKDEIYNPTKDSLETLALYPFLNQWKYKFKYSGTDEDGTTDDTVYPDITLEPEILSALVQGLTMLNKKTKIVLNNQWGE